MDRCYAEYNPVLPVLPEIGRFSSAVASSQYQLLLYVVLALASQRTPGYPALRNQLEALFRKLALDVEASTRNRLSAIQALLILCWWPLEYEPKSSNPSWLYCSIATHTALRFGLHQPHRAADFDYRESDRDAATEVRSRTWAACIIVNQT